MGEHYTKSLQLAKALAEGAGATGAAGDDVATVLEAACDALGVEVDA